MGVARGVVTDGDARREKSLARRFIFALAWCLLLCGQCQQVDGATSLCAPGMTRRSRWNVALGNEVFSSPALSSDQKVLFVGSGAKLWAIHAVDGTLKWNFTTGGTVFSSPVISTDEKTVFVGGTNKFYAIHAANGTKKWEAGTKQRIESSPAVSSDGETVFVGTNTQDVAGAQGLLLGRLIAFHAANGTLKWLFEGNGSMKSSPAISNDQQVVFIGGGKDGKLYAIHAANGTKKWQFDVRQDYWRDFKFDPRIVGWPTPEVYSSTAVSDGDKLVFFGTACRRTRGRLYALNAADGSKKWSLETGGDVNSSPALSKDGKVVFVGSTDYKLYAIDVANGTKKWDWDTTGQVSSSPTLSSDGKAVFIGSERDRLYALNVADGTKKWMFRTSRQIRSTPVLSSDDETIYFGSHDERVYAVNTCSCPAGKHHPKHNPELPRSYVCGDCPAGKYSDRIESDTCIDCGEGQYSEATGMDSGSTCERCEKGKYAAHCSTGMASPKDCIKCGPGQTTKGTGAVGPGECHLDELIPITATIAATTFIVIFMTTLLLVTRRIRYRHKFTAVRLGRRRCGIHRWSLDFPRSSRFSHENVTEGARLGCGTFGEVNQGTLLVGKATLSIAVKHVLESKATDVQRQDTIVECRLQCELKSPFVVKCFGFLQGPGPGDFSILLELMDLGDLPGYCKSVVDKRGGRIPEATRLRWMIEVAAALEYMHASNLIHADVAARNLVLCHSKTGVSCKLSDFGLSHAIDPSQQAYLLPRGQPVPFRWTAPECLPCDANFVHGTVSSSSSSSSSSRGGSSGGGGDVLRLTRANDVWAFGVTIWEVEGLAACGELMKPLKGVPTENLYGDLITRKAKLEFKFSSNDKTIDTFKDLAHTAQKGCLRLRPWARATMSNIRQRLQAATLCEATLWKQEEIHKWLDRMGAPRIDSADLWDIDDYELLMSEILNDDTRPEYMDQLKGSLLQPDDPGSLNIRSTTPLIGQQLSIRLGQELTGLSELISFVEGDAWPRGTITGHPERFTWMAGRHKQRFHIRTQSYKAGVRATSAASAASATSATSAAQGPPDPLLPGSIYGTEVPGSVLKINPNLPSGSGGGKTRRLPGPRRSTGNSAPSVAGPEGDQATPGMASETKHAGGAPKHPASSSTPAASASAAASTARRWSRDVELTPLDVDSLGGGGEGRKKTDEDKVPQQGIIVTSRSEEDSSEVEHWV